MKIKDDTELQNEYLRHMSGDVDPMDDYIGIFAGGVI